MAIQRNLLSNLYTVNFKGREFRCELGQSSLILRSERKIRLFLLESIIYSRIVGDKEVEIVSLDRQRRNTKKGLVEVRPRVIRRIVLGTASHESSAFWHAEITRALEAQRAETRERSVPADVLEQYGFANDLEGFVASREKRIRVIINPHGGAKNGLRDFNLKIREHLQRAGLVFEEELTEFGGHAYEKGYTHEFHKYEGVVLVGGDGLAFEFVNGLMARRDNKTAAFLTPFTIFPFGSENCLAHSIGTGHLYTALHALIKRKQRNLDALCVRTGDGTSQYSLCGLVYGIGSDMVLDYETTRHLKSLRYPFLKAKWGFFRKRVHEATVHYLLAPDEEDDDGEYEKCDRDAPGCRVCLQRTRSRRIDHAGVLAGSEASMPSVSSVNNRRNERSDHMHKWRHSRNQNEYPDIPESLFSVEELKEGVTGQWKIEAGPFYSIAAVNSHPESKFSHCSDGCIDVLMNKTGNIIETLDMGIKYITGSDASTPLIKYRKIKRLVIEPKTDAVMGIDGELLPLTSVICVDICPSLFLTYGEY